jgi:hypothetical protein
MPLFPSASSNSLLVPAMLALCSIILPQHLQAIIARMMKASISPGLGCRFSVAETGATDHMFLNKLAFISYRSIPNLQVWMGNGVALPSSLLMVSASLFAMRYMCQVLRFHSTAFAHTSSNMVVAFWGPSKLGCWCISLSLFSWWTCHPTATSPTNLLAGLPRWTPYTTCSHAVLLLYTFQNSLLCHARLLILWH